MSDANPIVFEVIHGRPVRVRTESRQRAEQWIDNAIYYREDTCAAIRRLADSTPGVEGWAVLLAVIALWDGLDADGKAEALAAFAAPRDGLKDGLLLAEGAADEPPPDPAPPPPDPTFAPVAVGTRVVEHMTDGGTVYEGVVIAVCEECVTVRRERPPVGLRDAPTVALRWNEFAVLPKSPQGRGWDGAA